MQREGENPRVIVGRLHRERRKHSVALVEAPRKKLPHHHPQALRLALAHMMAQALEAGEFASQAELAAWLGFTPAYISRLLDLTLLPPWEQEEVLGVGSLPHRANEPLVAEGIDGWPHPITALP